MTSPSTEAWIFEGHFRRLDKVPPPGHREDSSHGMETDDSRRNAHTEDFTSVRWNGVLYQLTPKQRDVIAILWESHEEGIPCVSGTALMEAAECGKLSGLFKGSPAWGKLIVQAHLHGGRFGTFRLAPTDRPASIA